MAKGLIAVLAILVFGALTTARLVHAQAAERCGQEIVRAQCSNCHDRGLHGAPRIDDRLAWTPRLKTA